MGLRKNARRLLGLQPKSAQVQFSNDGLDVRGRNLGFLDDPKFRFGWQKAVEGNMSGWNGRPPDIRWRAHTALWAARHGLRLEGDFVECGVFLGFLSLTICHATDFQREDRTFYLFDTFDGMPYSAPNDGTAHLYFDCYEEAKKNFSPFPNARLVRGVLPDTLGTVSLKKIAYLSIDLNNAAAEMGTIKELWDRLSPGAVVVLDDYGFQGFDAQYETWNQFAESKNIHILTCPTGQGLLIKP